MVGVISNVVTITAEDNPTAMAETIIHALRSIGHTEVQVKAARAMNIATQAIALVREYFAGGEARLMVIPYLTELEIDNQKRATMCFVIELRSQRRLLTH